MEVVYWGTAIASLVAVWLNIKQQAACFLIWGITNATWTVVDYLHGIYAQAVLQLVYLGLSVYGLRKWRRREERNVREDTT